MSMFENLNYVYRVEGLVVLGILIFIGYLLYSLDLLKKGK